VSADSRIGTEIAGYRVESVLGRGGMSVVYLAEQRFPQRKVALKLLAPELAEDQSFRERFIRESNAAASLDHPNIIPIYGAGEADDVLYIAMRYVEGSDLRRLLDQHGALDPFRAVSIVSQAAGALDTAHERGLVHRDVKPGNILLATPTGSGSIDHVYVSDFGLIKSPGAERELTRSGQIMGSVGYIAPEQIQGQHVDGRADVYSLGCVLFECLTGTAPFGGEVDAAVLWAHVQERPPRVSATRAELPAALDDVVSKAMAKSRDDRYSTCGELASAAQEALGRRANLVPAERRWGRRRLIAGALALAVVITAVAFVSLRGGSGKPGAGLSACEVTATARLHDASFNEAAYQGLTQATADLGVNASVRISKSAKDYGPNIQHSIDQGCSLIVTVAYQEYRATQTAAKANPGQRFAALGFFYQPSLPNVLGLLSRIPEAAFLAGYLAAGMTGTGKVATLGGLNIPVVTGYMDGFAAGILKYNRDHGTSVQLLGWDPATRTGAFVSKDFPGAFTDEAEADRLATALISEGADILLPVAGQAGLGADRAAQKAGHVLLVGVDTDQFLTAPEFGPLWLTSIVERYDLEVENAMRRVVEGRFRGGVAWGNLKNGGVALAPFHELAGAVPKALKAELDDLRAGIVDGSVRVGWNYYL
jgi:basic membrane lipoprotein Med (substrate-binding protein (PBP1-ABC) superfamily)